ncbi:MAG: tetratricopeptide repeat protein [Verrucomicrobia bacterium]|nr:tetratricopeptide repeat protein [Verrucomicrobiota bacterium]
MERYLAAQEPGTDAAARDAQQLVYDAWEATTDEREMELMLQALELDPGNPDALLHVLCTLPMTADQEIEALRMVVAVAERKLGPKAFEEYAGAFWGFIETRPYMRARERLAECLRAAGRLEEAVSEWHAMLNLNPGDNQGVRYALVPGLLVLRRLQEARQILEKYPGAAGFNAVFAWGHALERFLSDDLPGAAAALMVARKQNPHMQAYIKGHRKVPRQLPDAYSPGSKEEAVCFAEALQAAWEKHPVALKWLETQRTK